MQVDTNNAFRNGTIDIDFVELGQRLRAYRTGAGLKAEDVAASLGLSRAAVYLLEKGEIVKVETLVRLAALLGVSTASLLGVEMEYYSNAVAYFERMRQLEVDSKHLMMHFEPVSFLLTTDGYLVHLRERLMDAVPKGRAARERWEKQVDDIISVFQERKRHYIEHRPSITNLIGLREVEGFLRFGLLGRAEFSPAVRKRRVAAVQTEVAHIISLLESESIGVQVGVVEGGMPGVNFQIFRQKNRSYVGVSPLRLHEIPEVNSAVASMTASPEAVTLYQDMFKAWWLRASKGSDGSRLIKQLVSRLQRKGA